LFLIERGNVLLRDDEEEARPGRRPIFAAAAPKPEPRIFVVSDIRLYRDGIGAILEHHRCGEIVGSASLDDAMEQAPPARPEILLIDASLIDGPHAPRRLRELLSGLKVVAFAVSETGDQLIACAEAGIAGYVPRNASGEELAGVLRSALRGECRCPPNVTTLLLDHIATLAAGRGPAGGARSPAAPLTARERDIVPLVMRGLSNKEIANLMGVEPATVKNHVHNLLGKLGARRRGEVAALLHGQPTGQAIGGFATTAAPE
jgi:DNA-binding NarL/FixJ family response regulator